MSRHISRAKHKTLPALTPGQEVTRTVSGGPGSSIIDMPAPGCWNLLLAWSGHTDSMAITYLGS